MHPWFIFTDTGACLRVDGDSITQAVAAFRKMTHPKKGDIVGVIRGAAEMHAYGAIRATPVFGVICCVVENTPVPAAAGSAGKDAR